MIILFFMSPAWRQLLGKHKGKTLVEFCRRPRIHERLTGFIVDYSDSLILLHRLDWNTFILDGYTLLRNADVESKRFFTRKSYWQNKAVRKLKLRPQSIPGLSLTNWPEAVTSVSKRSPLIHIECEIAHPDECYIGVPLKLTEKLLTLDNLDPNAEWTGPWSQKLNQITRIDFGGGYERALAATAPKRSAKVLKQFGLSLIDRPHQKSWLKTLRALQGLELHRIEEN